MEVADELLVELADSVEMGLGGLEVGREGGVVVEG